MYACEAQKHTHTHTHAPLEPVPQLYILHVQDLENLVLRRGQRLPKQRRDLRELPDPAGHRNQVKPGTRKPLLKPSRKQSFEAGAYKSTFRYLFRVVGVGVGGGGGGGG